MQDHTPLSGWAIQRAQAANPRRAHLFFGGHVGLQAWGVGRAIAIIL
jgi:hypothetical protein